MKRKKSVTVLIIIVAVLIASLLINNQIRTLQSQINELQAQNDELEKQNDELQEQNSELQNRLNNLQEAIGNVEIMALYVEDWYNPGDLIYVRPFNVTIQNNGTHDAYGITLNCKITGNQSNLFYDFYYADPLENTLDVIHVGESRVMRVFLETRLELASQFSGCNLVASLMFDNIVLDEWVESF
jgi:FtsZ-binding cell division protein ZapB